MAKDATYSGDPSNSARDRVRFEIGDTDCHDALLSDLELDFFVGAGDDVLTVEASILYAASRAAGQIANSFATRVDEKIGATQKSLQQIVDNFLAMEMRLRVRSGRSRTQVPIASFYSGGQSEAEKQSDKLDLDLVQPVIEKDQFRHPGEPDLSGAS